MIARCVSSLLVACGVVVGQQLGWQIPSPPSPHGYYWVSSFGDYDGDGTRDALVLLYLDELLPTAIGAHRIVSGLDGSTLWERQDYFAGAMIDGGDIDGDGMHDIVMSHGAGPPGGISVAAWSVGGNYWIWNVAQPLGGFGNAKLGDLDLDGDGRPDFVTSSISTVQGSDIFAYDGYGTLLYTIPCWSQGLAASSFAKMGDMDGDGCDDFIAGCQDVTARGAIMLVSGKTGTILRLSYGLLPGDNIANHASNVGDLDGDGVPDYAGFPWWSASRAMITVFSGQTGAVLRTWPEFANSVVTGEDVDRDGVPDIVLGADYPIVSFVWGRTMAFSGRDGSELWRVDNFMPPAGSGVSNGGSGWMWKSATLGVRAGEHYPAIAWYDQEWLTSTTAYGRVRAYGTARAGQGPITGVACTSSGTLPLIGVRKLGAGAANTAFRTTVAKTHGNALAALNLNFTAMPTPVDLTSIGFAGCRVYVDPVAAYLRVTGTTGLDRGYAAVDLPYPLSSSAVGTDVVAQWLVYEPATLAHAATQAHAIRLP